jgi:GT2 family glycosyltransferase
MAKKGRVLAICVNWNGGEVLSETLNSLIHSDYPDLDITIVDNASRDGSVDNLPSSLHQVRLSSNLGYGGALNHVLHQVLDNGDCVYDYFLLLNNDLTLATDTVSKLVSCAQRTESHAVAPRVLLFDDKTRIEAAWGEVVWSHVLVDFKGKNALSNDLRWKENRSVQILLGSILLIHRSLIETVGYFDERFFMYHEEVDLLYRAWLNGMKSFYCSETEVLHRSGHSLRRHPNKKIYWIRKNTVLFLRKYNVPFGKWSRFFGTLIISLGVNLILLRFSRLGAICSGVVDGFRSEMNSKTGSSPPF